MTLLVALLSACPGRVRSRCARTCAKEAACAEELRVEHDRSECVEACNTLDRDPSLRPAVDQHVNCVERAGDCRALLECE